MGLMRWIRRRLLGGAEELYVDPLQGETSADEAHAQYLLEQRQRDLAKKLQAEGRSILQGYHPPEPFVADRMSVWANKEGWVPPSEQRRRVRAAKFQPAQVVVRNTNTTKSS